MTFLLKINYFLISILLFIFSCSKEENASFTTFQTLTQDELCGIYFWNQMEGIAVGGNTWTRAIRLSTNDGGLSWKKDSLFDKQIFCLGSNLQGLLIGLGIEFNCYQFTTQQTTISKLGDFRFFRALDVYNPELIIAAGGESFGTGYLEKINTISLTSRQILTINKELDAVQCIDSLNWVAAGYGIILRSRDAGEHWDTLDYSGDHFRDMSFADSVGYIIGITGTILKSDDAGFTWNKIRKSQSIFVKNFPLRTVCFKNKWEGIIGGEDGLIWRTTNGGTSWITLNGLPDCNYLDSFWDGSHFWLCGSNGVIIRLED